MQVVKLLALVDIIRGAKNGIALSWALVLLFLKDMITSLRRSHKVPIPAKSTELKTEVFKGSSEHWNTTCGSHRQWDEKLIEWVEIPKEKRKCSDLYTKYPFVFEMANGSEVLRQGNEVIHRSFIE